MTSTLAGWLLTYLMHSTLLIGLAWLVSRRLPERRIALREALWRFALIGGLITASAQLAAGVEPWSGSWSLPGGASAEAQEPLVTSAPLAAPAPVPAGRSSADPAVPAPGMAAVPVPRPAPGAPDFHRWLVTAWLTGAAVLFSLLAASYVHFRLRLRDRRTVASGPLADRLERLLDRVRSRPVRLCRSESLHVPLARGLRRWEICLPSATLSR